MRLSKGAMGSQPEAITKMRKKISPYLQRENMTINSKSRSRHIPPLPSNRNLGDDGRMRSLVRRAGEKKLRRTDGGNKKGGR